ncbi:hypothetical protein PEC18_30175 [Paucibacter sp. O1-1]|nr:hypothetical protein [Paucibacter sp. O1-1]MDA3829987.1 hypothetical protein [Paucibacter sp. O1-1]
MELTLSVSEILHSRPERVTEKVVVIGLAHHRQVAAQRRRDAFELAGFCRIQELRRQALVARFAYTVAEEVVMARNVVAIIDGFAHVRICREIAAFVEIFPRGGLGQSQCIHPSVSNGELRRLTASLA